MASKPGSAFEVLVEAANGHRTVYRVTAADAAAAKVVVTAMVDVGSAGLDAAEPGNGIGSSDGR
ncbi:hypothetical protein [Micromonospora sp. CA-244673]|uniref:hypothetical protein n=1 Tax=Micromonospora sp. CA-244673 TaxID=3239958 RepID=UPI003D8D450E